MCRVALTAATRQGSPTRGHVALRGDKTSIRWLKTGIYSNVNNYSSAPGR